MRTATDTLLIRNGRLVEGTGVPAVADAALAARDGRITYAGPARGLPDLPRERTEIDARGGTLMPGLVEAHFHPTYFHVPPLEDLHIKYPVEDLTLLAAGHARPAPGIG